MAGLVYCEYRGHAFMDAFQRRGIIERDYAKNPNWAVRGWTNTLEKMHYDCDIVFLGNSITAGSDFQAFFPDKRIVNLGYSGDIIPSMISRIDMVKAVSPEKVFIMAGTNDLVHISINKYVARYDALITGLQQSLPHARIYVQSVLPVNHKLRPDYPANKKIEEANKEISMLAKERGCTFINLYDFYMEDGEMKEYLTSDGVHLKKEAYSIWAKVIEKYIYDLN